MRIPLFSHAFARLRKHAESKLRVQLSIMYVLMVLVFLVTAVGLSYRRSVLAVEREMTASNDKLAALLSMQVEDYFKQVNNVFFQFCLKDDLISLLNEWQATVDPSRRLLLRANILNRQLFELVYMLPSVYSVAYCDNRTGSIMVRNRHRAAFYQDAAHMPQGWFGELVERARTHPGQLVYLVPHPYAPVAPLRDFSESVISFAKEVRNPLRLRERLGVIVVSVDSSELERIAFDIHSSPEAIRVVLDSDGRVLFSSHSECVEPGGLWPDGINGSEPRTTQPQTIHVASGDYLVFGGNTSASQYPTRILIPENELYTVSRQILYQNLLILAATLVFAFIGIGVISYRISHPLEVITDKFIQMAAGDLNQEVESKRNDEIGRLSLAFNQLASRMRRLVYQEYEARLKEQDAQMKALQFQMDPHCIYNSLQLISSLATLKGAEDIRTVACGLGNLIRYTMDTRANVVSLRQELEYVRDYLGILKMRYGERLAFTLDVEEGLREISVLKLTLQPIIENAIVHGMKNDSSERMRVSVRGYRSGEYAILEVADNGCGIASDRLSSIRMGLCQDGTGFYSPEDNLGLKNLLARIRIFYQGRGSLRIDSDEGQGTTVTLVIPVIHCKEGAQD